MKLRIVVFGVELARIELDLPDSPVPPPVASVATRGVKWASKHWVKGIFS
jgi:hypothetical protein